MEGRNEYEMVTRLTLEGVTYIVKLIGQGAEEMLAFMAAAAKKATSAEKSAGKESLKKLLSSGKELRCFTLNEDVVKDFGKEAKRYGIVYTMIRRSSSDKANGTFDVMVKAEDAIRLNRILERLNVATLDAKPAENGNTAENGSGQLVENGPVLSDNISEARAFVMQCMEEERNPQQAVQQEDLFTAQSKPQNVPLEQRTSVINDIEEINEKIEANANNQTVNPEFASFINSIMDMKKDEQSATEIFNAVPKGKRYIDDDELRVGEVNESRG